MPMRDDCKFFQTRTYRSGDTARFCALDLAPEAPWRCPADCPRYTKRVGDAGFAGPASGGGKAEHEDAELGEGVAALLGSADEVISAASSEIMAEERQRQRAQAIAEAREPWWKQLRRRPPWRR